MLVIFFSPCTIVNFHLYNHASVAFFKMIIHFSFLSRNVLGLYKHVQIHTYICFFFLHSTPQTVLQLAFSQCILLILMLSNMNVFNKLLYWPTFRLFQFFTSKGYFYDRPFIYLCTFVWVYPKGNFPSGETAGSKEIHI